VTKATVRAVAAVKAHDAPVPKATWPWSAAMGKTS